MIKKTVKYVDFEGMEREEDLYFNIDEAEIVDWVTQENGDIISIIIELTKATNPLQVIPKVKEFVLRAYGVKSKDGRSFIKSPEVVENFKYSKAFYEVYMEVASNDKALIEFIDGILPEKYRPTNLSDEEVEETLKGIDPSILSENNAQKLIERIRETSK